MELGATEEEGAQFAPDDVKKKHQLNLGQSSELIQVEYSADALDVTGRPIAAEPIVSINRILGRGYNFGIITEGKNAYLWGDNSSHQLGAGEWLQYVEDLDPDTREPNGKHSEKYMQGHEYANSPVKLQTADAKGGALEKVIEVSFGGYVGGKVQSLAVTMDVEYDYTGGLETVLSRTYKTYGWGSGEFKKNGFDNDKVVSRTYDSWAWGSNDNNKAAMSQSGIRLARATPIQLFTPTAGVSYLDPGVQLKSMSAGGNHSAGYDTNGIVYTFGSNEYGQLGNFTYSSKDDGEHAGPRPMVNDYPDVESYLAAVENWKEREVASGGVELVDEEHIAIFQVDEQRNTDGSVNQTMTENYHFQAKIGQEENELPLFVAQYMYSFSVDKEVDEAKTLLLKYDVLDDSTAQLGNLNLIATSTQEVGTREREETYTNDALHQRIVKYKPVSIRTPKDENNFGTTRIIAKYEPRKEDGSIDENLSKTGVAIVNMLGRDQMGTDENGESVLAHPFQAMPQVTAGDEFIPARTRRSSTR